MKQKNGIDNRHYWLWVTSPEHWLDEEGNDSPFLNPKKKDYKGGEWSCGKETKKGDLVFLWRSKKELSKYLHSMGIKKVITPKSGIGYLVRAESKADGPRNDEPWPYWCYYKPLYKFENPVTVEDFKNDLILKKSYPHKTHFVRNSFPLSKEEWDRINQVAFRKNPGYKTFLENLLKTKFSPSPNGGGQRTEDKRPKIEKGLTEKARERVFRKYGPGGEGEEHKKLKNWVAENPKSIGLLDVKDSPKIEYVFISGDTADVLFERENSKFAVVEIETDNPEPGFYQALKYKILKCAEAKIDITSADVKAILVAWSIPNFVKELCNQYNVEFQEISKDEYNQGNRKG
jgi:hypothetical protein